MATKKISKRTTATKAYDMQGKVIRLLRTKLTADGGQNSLLYSDLRHALKHDTATVCTIVRPEHGSPCLMARYINFKYPPYHIGCHAFDLKNLNRIFIAAGMRTTKKALAAGAGL